MKLHELTASATKKATKRVGRGPGSGMGKTSTRGEKGQKARAGSGIPAWFQGGQSPLYRRIPKRGFNNAMFATRYATINLSDLNKFELIILGYDIGYIDVKSFPGKIRIIQGSKDKFGDTALIIATKNNLLEMITFLIKNGADVNAKNNSNSTPLFFANLESAKILIDNHVDVNAKDKDGATILFIADFELSKLLIENNADVNAKDNSNSTPLFFAVTFNDIDKVKLLINNKADINHKNDSTHTVLSIANYFHFTEMINLLKKYGAK